MSTVIDATKVFERRENWRRIQRCAEINCENAARIHKRTEEQLAEAYAFLRAVEKKRAEDDISWRLPSDTEVPFSA